MSDPLLFVLICLTAYRVWRLVAHDEFPPTMWVRRGVERFAERRFGPVWAAGMRCPWCSGSHIAFITTAAVWHFRPLTLPFLWFAAPATVVGVFAQYDPG